MAKLKLKPPTKPVENWEAVRDAWVQTVNQLVTDVEGWCRARDWPTRRIEKKINDRSLGEYVVPALLIQVDLVKLLLEPVARFAPGSDGVVDLYRMPEYDDVASIYHRNGAWWVHYIVTGGEVPLESRQGDANVAAEQLIQPFTKKEFARLVPLMV